MDIQGNLFDLLQQYDALLQYNLEPHLTDEEREVQRAHYDHVHERLQMYRELAKEQQ